MPPALLNQEHILHEFMAIHEEMLNNVASDLVVPGNMPRSGESLEDSLDKSRLAGLLTYMRHRPRHIISRLRHNMPWISHRLDTIVKYAAAVPWSMPRLAATALYVSILPTELYEIWLQR
eukprot:4410008-Amphidinium_carterae.1